MVNMTEFSRLFAKKYGVKYKDSTYICKGVFQLLGELLCEHEEDVILNNLCSFKRKRTPARRSKHPTTGEIGIIPAHDVIKFKVSERFYSDAPEEDVENCEEYDGEKDGL